jgi:hypothetical protein
VESIFSMNKATATMSGTIRSYELDVVFKDWRAPLESWP